MHPTLHPASDVPSHLRLYQHPHSIMPHSYKSTTSALTKASRALHTPVQPHHYASWTAARRRAWDRRRLSPDAYFYDYVHPSFTPITTRFSPAEHALFLAALHHVSSPRRWGTVSLLVPGRVGAQCRRYFHRIGRAGFITFSGAVRKTLTARAHVSDPASKKRKLSSANALFLRRVLKKFIPQHLPQVDDTMLRPVGKRFLRKISKVQQSEDNDEEDNPLQISDVKMLTYIPTKPSSLDSTGVSTPAKDDDEPNLQPTFSTASASTYFTAQAKSSPQKRSAPDYDLEESKPKKSKRNKIAAVSPSEVKTRKPRSTTRAEKISNSARRNCIRHAETSLGETPARKSRTSMRGSHFEMDDNLEDVRSMPHSTPGSSQYYQDDGMSSSTLLGSELEQSSYTEVDIRLSKRTHISEDDMLMMTFQPEECEKQQTPPADDEKKSKRRSRRCHLETNKKGNDVSDYTDIKTDSVQTGRVDSTTHELRRNEIKANSNCEGMQVDFVATASPAIRSISVPDTGLQSQAHNDTTAGELVELPRRLHITKQCTTSLNFREKARSNLKTRPQHQLDDQLSLTGTEDGEMLNMAMPHEDDEYEKGTPPVSGVLHRRVAAPSGLERASISFLMNEVDAEIGKAECSEPEREERVRPLNCARADGQESPRICRKAMWRAEIMLETTRLFCEDVSDEGKALGHEEEREAVRREFESRYAEVEQWRAEQSPGPTVDEREEWMWEKIGVWLDNRMTEMEERQTMGVEAWQSLARVMYL